MIIRNKWNNRVRNWGVYGLESFETGKDLVNLENQADETLLKSAQGTDFIGIYFNLTTQKRHSIRSTSGLLSLILNSLRRGSKKSNTHIDITVITGGA